MLSFQSKRRSRVSHQYSAPESKCASWLFPQQENQTRKNIREYTFSDLKHGFKNLKRVLTSTQAEFNFQAVGMDSWIQSALKPIYSWDPIFESAAWFFDIILKFIFTSIFQIKIHGNITYAGGWSLWSPFCSNLPYTDPLSELLT